MAPFSLSGIACVNSNEFVQSTVLVDFKQTQDRFIAKLSSGTYILDFGCGSGRDTKYFIDNGYIVDAIDGSEKLCKIASAYTRIDVKQMLFDGLAEVEKYDGIWACSSILHLSRLTLANVLTKIGFVIADLGISWHSEKVC